MNGTTYAVDTAKNVMQLHWVDVETGEIHRKRLSRAKFLEFFAQLQPVRVAMEACGGAHHWARALTAIGHAVELLPAGQIRAFVRGNKDDMADARAIWVAAGQGDIRRVPIKSTEQQAILSLHRTRSHWMTVRTATINSLRGLLYEFGVFIPQGRQAALRMLEQQRADIDARLPPLMMRLLTEQLRSLREIDHDIEVLDEEIASVQHSVGAAQTLREVPGIGVLGATALAAVLGNASAWRNGRDFAASLGLCPRHTGTGGKVKMGGISRRGDPYLRTLLIAGARAVVARKNCSSWVQALLSRRPTNVAVVALANKLARTAWALIAHNRRYDVQWHPIAPECQPDVKPATAA
ncbi:MULTISPECIES: IS110 family transposase [unclassified Caballeronia]|uniref:IS110 family transposase n=1 Tax=unclassified Caballeronia TaxID=2646786 RepID=UPI0020280038|nr:MULTISPECIES: IS110 family transposase [unclassified Caballeronia]